MSLKILMDNISNEIFSRKFSNCSKEENYFDCAKILFYGNILLFYNHFRFDIVLLIFW